MGEYFTSNQNKELLWGLLIEQNSFNGIDAKHKSNIELVFERTIKIVDLNQKNDSLFNKNKEVIKEMVIYLNTLKTSQQSHNLQQNNSLNYTHDEIHKAKIERFDNELKQKQHEFESIIKKDVPNSIDFSDKLDEKIGDKMDLLISQTIAMRENQLKQILSETSPPNKSNIQNLTNSTPLFKIDSLSKNVSNNNTNKDYVKLNIGEDVDANLTKNIIVDLNNNNKKVSFDDKEHIFNYENQSNSNENELEYRTDHTKLNSFLNKLKHIENNDFNTQISTIVNESENNGFSIENNKIGLNNLDSNKLDLIINLLNTINLKLDKVLYNH